MPSSLILKVLLRTLCLWCCADSFSSAEAAPPVRRVQKLQADWASGMLFSSEARLINASQHRCQGVIFHHMRNFGMGSDLHTWAQALSNAMARNLSLLQRPEPWLWRSGHFCRDAGELPLQCYFQMNNPCVVDAAQIPRMNLSDRRQHAPRLDPRFQDFQRPPGTDPQPQRSSRLRAAAMELLFSRLSSTLVETAVEEVFRAAGGNVPHPLITVHMRWGDKASEMQILPAKVYVQAIRALVRQFQLHAPSVFLTTEDPAALHDLRGAVSSHADTRSWRLYTYDRAIFQQHRTAARAQAGAVKSMVRMSELSGGALGMHSLVSLLIALEADYFVLTSRSNWSRLLDELRRTRVEPSRRMSGGACVLPPSTAEALAARRHDSDLRGEGRGGACTYMVDLSVHQLRS